MRRLDSTIDSKGMSMSKLWEWMIDGETWSATKNGLQIVGYGWERHLSRPKPNLMISSGKDTENC